MTEADREKYLDLVAQNERATEISNALEDQAELERLQERKAELQQNKALATMLEIGKRAGRIQSAMLIGDFVNTLAISQVRELKNSHKEAGLTWGEACKMTGFSTQRADQILRLGNTLGDEFVANASDLGLSFRTLEAARQLPEEVRSRLIAGEVVDLEDVTKQELTHVIKDLAREHAEEKTEWAKRDATLAKNLNKTGKLYEEAREEAASLREALEAALSGLPADRARAVTRCQEAERAIMAHLAVLKNTTVLNQLEPAFVARLVSGCEMVRAMADYTGRVIVTLADGMEVDEEMGAEAREMNAYIAGVDGTTPHPGI